MLPTFIVLCSFFYVALIVFLIIKGLESHFKCHLQGEKNQIWMIYLGTEMVHALGMTEVCIKHVYGLLIFQIISWHLTLNGT